MPVKALLQQLLQVVHNGDIVNMLALTEPIQPEQIPSSLYESLFARTLWQQYEKIFRNKNAESNGCSSYVLPIESTFSNVMPAAQGASSGETCYRYEYCVVYDAEDRPEEDQLYKVVRQFKDLENSQERQTHEVICLQAKLTYENLNDNWVISLFKADYASWFNYLLPGLHKHNLVIPLGGTSNHFRVEKLAQLGGWDSFNVAEDCDLGVWISRRGYAVQVVNSITWEVANPRMVPWVKQRSRWIKGYAQSYFVHMRRPLVLWRELGWKRFWGFQLTVGAGFLLPMITPFFWVLTTFYVIALVGLVFFALTGMQSSLNPLLSEQLRLPMRFINDIHYYWVLPLGTGSLFISNVIYFLILVIGQLRHPKPGTTRWIVTLWWLYWFYMNWAAWKALFEYLFDPFHWDKSDHSFAG